MIGSNRNSLPNCYNHVCENSIFKCPFWKPAPASTRIIQPRPPPMGVPRLNYPFPTVIVRGSLNFSERPFIISIPAIKYGAFASKALRSTALPPPCMSVICMNIAFLHLTCNEGRFQTALSLLYADCARFMLNH